MLPSIVSKTLKLSSRSSDYTFRSFFYGASRVLQQEFYNADTKGFWRCIHTSTYFYDKPADINIPQISKQSEKVITQSATGDIIVKTETDANKVVTKVTIEKNKPVSPSPKTGVYTAFILDQFLFLSFFPITVMKC